MKNLRLTILEAQELLLMSQSSVYAWIDKGKLQATDGPSGKIILISEQEANQIREMNLKSKRNKTSKFGSMPPEHDTNSEIFETNNSEIPENSSKNYNENSDKILTAKLISELKELALEAGKYKQLEIIRNEEKENCKYWEEKYFELHADLNAKNQEIFDLKLKISSLEQKLEKLENKGLFSNIFKKK